MSVYVDPLFDWGGSRTFRWTRSCHMYADTLDELHAMAQKIGMKRAWFQDHDLPHYDLVESRRKKAVQYGAVEVEFKHLVLYIRRNKKDEQCKEQQKESMTSVTDIES